MSGGGGAAAWEHKDGVQTQPSRRAEGAEHGDVWKRERLAGRAGTASPDWATEVPRPRPPFCTRVPRPTLRGQAPRLFPLRLVATTRISDPLRCGAALCITRDCAAAPPYLLVPLPAAPFAEDEAQSRYDARENRPGVRALLPWSARACQLQQIS